MIALTLGEVAAICGGVLNGADRAFRGLSTDSRSIEPGMLFCAIAGPNFDGNRFLGDAAMSGAAGSICSLANESLPCVVVNDPLVALHRLAEHWRDRFPIPCVAVTGSNGKTTVKEMVARILERIGPVLATHGNLNNHIGVPLTLSRLDASHQRMVVELGANHPGEIARLARMVHPDIGIITQIAPAHLEGFGSVEGVARAKGELIESLPATGTAVVHGDDGFQSLWRQLAGPRELLRFGFSPSFDVCAHHTQTTHGSAVRLDTPAGPVEFELHLSGRHNVANAAAAAAAAIALGVKTDEVGAGLGAVRPVSGRMMPRRGTRGMRILDDTYNANPESLRAALEVLATANHPRWLVLGDMAELGSDGGELHRDAGKQAREAGVDRLWCTGQLSRYAAESFGTGAAYFEQGTELIDALLEDLDLTATVLVKGSRSAQMERVVNALVGECTGSDRTCC